MDKYSRGAGLTGATLAALLGFLILLQPQPLAREAHHKARPMRTACGYLERGWRCTHIEATAYVIVRDSGCDNAPRYTEYSPFDVLSNI